MGQKTHPYAFRLGVVTDWKSKWYSDHNYVALVNEDWKIRDYLSGELLRGAVSRIDIERTRDRLIVDIHTARPGVVIGRRGSEAERLRGGLEDLTGRPVKLNINEVKDPDLDAALLARGIADQLENRIAFRRAMKRAVTAAMKAGAEGVRVEAKGRLGGADMGRREWYREGRVPLHTLRADIDFGTATAHTTVGTCGVKVWVYKGEVLESGSSSDRIAAEADLATGGPARRRSVKSRAEAAAEGGERKPRLIEAGGGKRLIEAGGGKKETGGRRIIEAGGGRRPTAAEAKVEYDNAREEVTVEPEDAVEGAETVTPDVVTGAADQAAPPTVADIEETVVAEPEDVDNITPEMVEDLADEAQAAAPEGDPELEDDPSSLPAEAEFDEAREGAATEAAESQPFGAGSARSNDDGSGPAGWEVKGNADSMLYHTPESPYYGRTKAEVWFQDEAAAAAAGFARWDHKKTEAGEGEEK
jgi:small subunit ribosomal protein S3